MKDEMKPSLTKRYFISRSTVRAEDYDEFWIRYKPERIIKKQIGNWGRWVIAIFFWLLATAILSSFFTGIGSPTSLTFIAMALLTFLAAIRLAPNYFLRFLYPTHIKLSPEGLTYHWFTPWLKANSRTIEWEKIIYVTTSDKKVLKTLSVDVEFNVDKYGFSLKDRLAFSLMAPAMSEGWLSRDRPVLKTNINGIASSEDRKKLELAIKKFIPSYRIEPKVADDLNMYIKFDSYTDMWLETLASSNESNLDSRLKAGHLLSNNSYEVIESLGSGGEALVYKARLLKPIPDVLGLDGVNRNETIIDMTDMNVTQSTMKPEIHKNTTVVLKEFVLPTQAGVNARQRVLENIREEAALWRKMRHPQIVRLLDFFAEEKRAYLVLEYVEGDSLKSKVRTKGDPLSEEEAVDLGVVMCDILTYLHSKNPPIVHRDFTPDNLILDKQGVLKLTDFNIAFQLEADTTKTVAGKHSYIPREQCRAETATLSDIYSFGCTMHFILSGSEPEALTTSSPASINPNVSSSLNDLVERATAQEQKDRFQSIGEVKEALLNLKKQI